MKLYQILTFVFCLTVYQLVQAQGTLTGQIQDAQGKPLGYANVAVLKAADGAVATGTFAGDQGNFLIAVPAAGQYKLRVRLVGYIPLETPVFEISERTPANDFGVLQLQEDTKLLQEVVVQAMRPAVITEAGKTTVQVAGTAMAGGATAYEVLARAPGVWVDQDGEIKLNGKTGVQILLNGHPSQLPANELQALLKSMAAENIQDVEILNNPSAKYDAQGAAGVININLKENTLTGVNGAVHAGYQQAVLEAFNAGGELSWKRGNWNTLAQVDLSDRAQFRTSRMHRSYRNGMNTNMSQDLEDECRTLTPAIRFGADYVLHEKHLIGVEGNISIRNGSSDIRSLVYLQEAGSGARNQVVANSQADVKDQNSNLNLHYRGRLDTLGAVLTANLDYVNLIRKDHTQFNNRYRNSQGNSTDQLSSKNPVSYNIYAARLDYTKVLGAAKLELGLKASAVESDNEVRFYTFSDRSAQLDSSRSNHFIYNEDIYAVYTSLSVPLGDAWQLQAGLRAEQTFVKGTSLTLEEERTADYFDLFPSIALQQRPHDKYEINYSYSRRVDRPQYT